MVAVLFQVDEADRGFLPERVRHPGVLVGQEERRLRVVRLDVTSEQICRVGGVDGDTPRRLRVAGFDLLDPEPVPGRQAMLIDGDINGAPAVRFGCDQAERPGNPKHVSHTFRCQPANMAECVRTDAVTGDESHQERTAFRHRPRVGDVDRSAPVGADVAVQVDTVTGFAGDRTGKGNRVLPRTVSDHLASAENVLAVSETRVGRPQSCTFAQTRDQFPGRVFAPRVDHIHERQGGSHGCRRRPPRVTGPGRQGACRPGGGEVRPAFRGRLLGKPVEIGVNLLKRDRLDPVNGDNPLMVGIRFDSLAVDELDLKQGRSFGDVRD